MHDIAAGQFFLSTMADEKNYFFEGTMPRTPPLESELGCLAPGNYRVIDGKLYRVLPGLPPNRTP